MGDTDAGDAWARNDPYIALTVLVTVLNNWGAVAGLLVGLKDAGAAVLIVGVIVTVGLELSGYEREPLREALLGR